MTDTTALQALADKVEAGEFYGVISARELGLENCGEGLPIVKTMYAAFSGSLDAAKALDEAVLPKDYIVASDSTGFAHIWRDEFEVTHNWTALISGNEARARLLAIIRALIAGGRE